MKNFKFLTSVSHFFSIIAPYRSRFYILFVILVFSAICETLSIGSVFPLLLSVIDPQSASSNIFLLRISNLFGENHLLLIVSLFTLVLFSCSTLIALLRSYYSAFFTNCLRHKWTTAIFKNYLQGRLLDVSMEKQGNLINSMISEPIFAAKAINSLIDLCVSSLIITSVTIFLFFINFWLTIISFVVVLAGIGLFWIISRSYSNNVGRRRVSYNQSINHLITESVSGIRTIKVFSLEENVFNDLNNRLSRLMRMMTKYSLIRSSPKPISEFIVIFILISFIILSDLFYTDRVVYILPTLSVFSLSLIKLFSMSSLFLSKRIDFSSYWPSVELVHNFSDRFIPECVDQGDPSPKHIENIVVSNVSFDYEDKNKLLDTVNLHFSSGQIVALVGKSGSGKSTLTDLLVKLLVPSSGQIFINKQPLSSLSGQSWRQLVSFVSQDPFLFHASIKDNIKLGCPSATDEQVLHASMGAQSHSFIQTLPQGYETIVGHRGFGLSGGQKQRIALAQAFLRKPSFLILDEATSGIDFDTERRIFDFIRSDFSSSIVLFITHRPSSLKYADVIHEIANGSISNPRTYNSMNS